MKNRLLRRLATLAGMTPLMLMAAPAYPQAPIRRHPPGGNASSLSGFTGPGVPVDTDGGPTWTARCLAAGTGVSIAHECGAAGNFTISIDTSVVPLYSQGTGAVSATGSVGTLYFETDANRAFFYTSTDTEHQILSVAPGALAQGDIFYINSSLVPTRLAPGTSGQFLQTQGAAADPQWAAAGTSDPDTTINIIDEFPGRSIASLTVGEWDWAISAGGTGTVTNGTGATCSWNGHFGTTCLNTGATDNSGVLFIAEPLTATDLTSTNWTITADILLREAVTSTAVFFGLAVGATGADSTAMSGGIGLWYDTDHSHTNWSAKICDSATTGCNSAGDATNQDYHDTGTAVAEDTWYKLAVEHDVTGVGGNPTYSFYIDDVLEATFCSSGCDEDLGNLPATELALSLAVWGRAASTSKTMGVDYVRVQMTVAR